MREGDEAQSRFMSPLVIVATILIIGVAFVSASYVMRLASDNGPVDVVVLKADETAYKVKPEVQENEKDDAAQSTVLDMLEDLKQNKGEVEIISLAPESPELPETSIEKDDLVADQSENKQTNSEAKAEDAESAAAEVEEPAKDEAEQPTVTQTAKPVSRPLTKEVVQEKARSEGPSMMVQLAAFRNQAKAQEQAALLTEKHRARLQGLSLGVMQIDAGNSGIFWRVITEPLPNEDARAICDGLKLAGQECILRKVDIQ